eukprot:2881501-Rhodomonas_salina.1
MPSPPRHGRGRYRPCLWSPTELSVLRGRSGSPCYLYPRHEQTPLQSVRVRSLGRNGAVCSQMRSRCI